MKIVTAKTNGDLNKTQRLVNEHSDDIAALKLASGDETAMQMLMKKFEEFKENIRDENSRLNKQMNNQTAAMEKMKQEMEMVKNVPEIVNSLSMKINRLSIRVDKIEMQLPPDVSELWGEIHTLQSGVEGCESEIQSLNARSNEMLHSLMADEALDSVVDTIHYTAAAKEHAVSGLGTLHVKVLQKSTKVRFTLWVFVCLRRYLTRNDLHVAVEHKVHGSCTQPWKRSHL